MANFRLKDYEKSWIEMLIQGDLDGINAIRTSSYGGNSYFNKIDITDGIVTLYKKNKYNFFNGRENEKTIEEETRVLDNPREIVNELKKYTYNKQLNEKLYLADLAQKKLAKKSTEQSFKDVHVKPLEKCVKDGQDNLKENELLTKYQPDPYVREENNSSDLDMEAVLFKTAIVTLGVMAVGTTAWYGTKYYRKKKAEKELNEKIRRWRDGEEIETSKIKNKVNKRFVIKEMRRK